MLTQTTYHKILDRQLRKVLGKGAEIPESMRPLLELISQTYAQYDDEKELLNNTMEVGMRELAESNAELNAQKSALEKAYRELAETQDKLSAAQKIAKLMQEVEEKNAQLLASEEELRQNLDVLQNTLEEVTLLKEDSEQSHKEAERLLKNVTDSINYAKRIQTAIMPKERDMQKYFDGFVFFRPRDIVSGDFYWFADKGDKKIIAVADCTGHGVSGAFMTMIGNNILNQIVHNFEIHAPNEILDLMPILLEKTLLHSEGKVKDGMDISIITTYEIDERPIRVEYAGAKNPLYYVKNGEFKEIKADRVPIWSNFQEDFSYQNHEILIDKEQERQKITFYLFSDGYQDQFGGEKRRKFMSLNFKNLISLIAENSMLEQKQLLEEHFDSWKGENRQTDDVLVVAVRI